jgi:hypothetical protein
MRPTVSSETLGSTKRIAADRSFTVPGNTTGGPGPYVALETFTGRSNSTGVPFGCHIWGDPSQPIANVTVSGTIQAVALSTVTVQTP